MTTTTLTWEHKSQTIAEGTEGAFRCEETAGYDHDDCRCVLVLAGRDGHYHEEKHKCIHGFQWFESWVSLAERHLDHVEKTVAQALPVEGEAKTP